MPGKAALIIGISSGSPLPGAIQDAATLKRTLSGNRTGVAGNWKSTLVTADQRDSGSALFGNAELLDKTLEEWIKASVEVGYDDLLFFFAGHATQHQGEVWLGAVDGDWLPLSQLVRRFAQVKANSITIILDCCGAGDIMEHVEALKLDASRSIALFAACLNDEQSFSWGSGFGFFAGLINQGLGGALSGNVTTARLHEFWYTAWDRQPAEVRARQHPHSALMGRPAELVIVADDALRHAAIPAIPALRDMLRAEQDGGLLRLWRVLPGQQPTLSSPWRQLQLQQGEIALAIAVAEPRDAYVVVSGPAGCRLLRTRGGDLLTSPLTDQPITSARFDDGLRYGRLTLLDGLGREWSIRLWKLEFREVSSDG